MNVLSVNISFDMHAKLSSMTFWPSVKGKCNWFGLCFPSDISIFAVANQGDVISMRQN